MIQADETFDGTWPFAPRFCAAAGFQHHYIDEGEGRPVVLLHGQPTWGYIYRRFIGALAAKHRVIVPDHMGFGKSQTPPDREYTLSTHVANLTSLIDALDLRDITFVMQDWGGSIGIGWCVSHPERSSQSGVAQHGLRLWRRRSSAICPIQPSRPGFAWILKDF